MIRKLIALVVLVTGLAAIGQPAQARIADFDSARFTAFSASSACAIQASASDVHFGAARERNAVQRKACPKPPKIVVIVPTVMLQADRARE